MIHIGPRSTRIITLDSDIVTIPNTKIATGVVHNYSPPNPQVRIQVPVAVTHETDPTSVRRILEDIVKKAVISCPDIIADNPQPTTQPTIYITTIDRNTVTFQITVHAKGSCKRVRV